MHSVQRNECVEEHDDYDQPDGDSDDGAGTDPDSLLVLRVEVSHETCGGLESTVVLFCHGAGLVKVDIKM